MNFRDKAMLARVSISMWSGRRHDKNATLEIERAHNSENMGRFNKILVDQSLLKPIEQAAGALRNAHYGFTLPWDDSDWRLLPAAQYFDASTEVQRAESVFWQRVDAMLLEYEAEVERSRQRLKDLWVASEYPRKDDLRARYNVRWNVIPIPDAQDFRIDLGDQEIDAVRAQIEARVAEATQTAVKGIYEQMFVVVSKMHERLSNPTATFRNSLTENIEKICELVPKLNFTGDPKIAEFGEEIKRKLAIYAPETLRESTYARQQTAENAAKIMDTMKEFMNG